ncbi:unnamed protein product [Protopolystoma xenopodis]|uniref:Uncharacterized protein n=1 Tax=Protopolystoma xenopodis TaxID=117903 RepID=A0A3S5CVW7_9PLAT|nr:unnamed protein product [Protopolystoma xenopodis]
MSPEVSGNKDTARQMEIWVSRLFFCRYYAQLHQLSALQVLDRHYVYSYFRWPIRSTDAIGQSVGKATGIEYHTLATTKKAPDRKSSPK